MPGSSPSRIACSTNVTSLSASASARPCFSGGLCRQGSDGMRLRSLLFVPGDRPERMEKALGLGADALILDLEDSVAPPAKPQARREVAAFLAANGGANLW